MDNPLNSQLLLLTVLAPFAGAALLGFFGTKWPKNLAALAGCFFSLLSGLTGIYLALGVLGGEGTGVAAGPWTYLATGASGFQVGLALDHLSAAMTVLVSVVAFLVHVYSASYLSGEARLGRYYSYLNLFQGMMLLLITGSDLLTLFAGWEGVGLCSYLLIGYWFEKAAPPTAGRKAFVVNRIGDAGFLFAAAGAYAAWGSLSSSVINARAPEDTAVAGTIGLFLLMGVAGKSALIHAATMVTAGIYLMLRLPGIFSVESVAVVVLALGLATALWGALSALGQDDIKKVMAYSTVSQLGLMAAGIGAGAPSGAFNHLLTHGFFKALLFLAAGSVIHALSGTQSLALMGGLMKGIPLTAFLMLTGVLAISGVPPLSGFFTKEQILAGLAHQGTGWLAAGLLVSFLTATYMSRMFALAFLGQSRGHHHPHESGPLMTIPMALLAVLSVGGYLLVRAGGILHVALEASHAAEGGEASHGWGLIAASLTAAVLGISLGLFSGLKPGRPRIPETLGEAARRSFGLDDGMTIAGRLLGPGLGSLSATLERLVLIRIPELLGGAWVLGAGAFRTLYSGRLQSYAWMMGAAIFILVLILGRELP